MNTTSKRKTFQDIKDKDYCDPNRRMDFVLFFEVTNGNPNGDPDAGNLPRIDPTDNHGIVTDVATKRKIRDYLQSALGQDIFIQNKTALNTLYFDEAKFLKESLTDESDCEAVASIFAELDAADTSVSSKKQAKAASEFKAILDAMKPKALLTIDSSDTEVSEVKETPIDWLMSLREKGMESLDFDFDEGHQVIRYTGANKKGPDLVKEIERIEDIPEAHSKSVKKILTLLAGNAGSGGSAKGKELVKHQMEKKFADIRLFGAVLTAGTNAGQIRGPMQLTFARSLQPIVPIESSITRVAITTAADALNKQTEMGRKPWVSWAAYEQHGFYNAPLGAVPSKGGTGVTREDLARFWEAVANMFPESQAASKGDMHVCELIVFVHDGPRGCAPFHKLRGKLKLEEQKGVTDETKGFEKRYKTPLTVTDEEKLRNHGITVHRPLTDLGYDI